MPEKKTIHDSILETIGNTPMVRISPRLTGSIQGEVLAKLEMFNPGSSVKDRIGTRMIEAAEKEGKLKPGGTIIEGTSGNTGVGLALAAKVKGYRVIFTIPDKMSQEKINLLKAFGAQVIVTPTAVAPDDPRSYHMVAHRLAEEIPNSLFPDQYSNPNNWQAHYHSTGPEIWEQCEGKIDTFVCGCGTGGTITGTGKFLKEKNPLVKIIGVDPAGSLYYQYFKSGKIGTPVPYKVEGIGQDDFPKNMDFSVLDDMIQVSDKDSFLTARKMTQTEGIFGGGSSGTAMWAALQVAKNIKKGERLVVLLPDTGERYLSKVYNDAWMQENQFLEARSEITALDVLSRKTGGPGQLFFVTPNRTLSDAVKMMKENEISYLPVLDGSKVLGVIREDQIVDLLIQGKNPVELKVSEVMADPLPLVELDTTSEEISRLLRQGRNPAVLVRMGKGEGQYGVITKFDLLQTLSP